MKRTKIYTNTEILFTLLFLVVFGTLATSCDMLADDPDAGQDGPELAQREVHVWSGSTSVIDLGALIQSNQAARVSITTQPGKGTLTELGKGLLQYKPIAQATTGYDVLGFTVYANGNQVLKKDSVIIILETDSTALPCGIYTADDYVYSTTTQAITIPVLANDFICGTDSANLEVSIYKPDALSPPYYGTANVVNNTIVYQASEVSSATDKIIYRVTTPAGNTSYGFVYIFRDSACTITLQDDYYELKKDSLKTDTAALFIFNNDKRCGQNTTIASLSIYKQPVLGAATLSDSVLRYKPDASWPIGQTDTIGYQVCTQTACYRAKVAIYLKK
jgi:hypothetical protein